MTQSNGELEHSKGSTIRLQSVAGCHDIDISTMRQQTKTIWTMDADYRLGVPPQANGDQPEGVEDENAGGTWDQSQQNVTVVF